MTWLKVRAVGEYGWRLKQYASVDTQAQQYRQARPLILALLAWPVLSGPVLLLAWLAWQRRQQLCGGRAGSGRAGSGQAGRGQAADMQRAEGGTVTAETAAAADSAHTAPHTAHADPPCDAGSVSAMLTASLRPACWPLGAVVVARRLLLILILTFATSHDVWVWASWVNTLVLALHVLLWPYVQWRDNVLEAVSLLSLCLQTTLLGASMDGHTLSAALYMLLLAPVATLVVLEVAERRQRRQRRDVAVDAAGKGTLCTTEPK